MTDTQIIQEVKELLSPEIPVLRTPKTVQILLIRQTHDYTILRTEETRELNVAVTPTSISDPKQRARVVFLATKQKAPESREFAAIVKDLYNNHELELDEGEAILLCELKDKLCRACPRCTLFGAVVTDQSSGIWKKRWNIKHRIEYSSAFSLEPYEMISENITFNAVTESTQLTGQALGTTENVSPLANFPSIISLNSPTWEELVMVIKNVLRCKSYGAEGRTKGDTVNHITGLVFANEEILTPLEYVLELSEPNSGSDIINTTNKIAQKYGDMCTFPEALKVFSPKDLETFVDHMQSLELDKNFVNKMFNDSIKFGKQIEARVE
jgi:CRISPR type I-D-associated protein Csc2